VEQSRLPRGRLLESLARQPQPYLKAWRAWPAFPLVALTAMALVGQWQMRADHQAGAMVLAANKPHQLTARLDPNERIADYTFWLMCFTGLLFVTSATQIAFLIRADRTAKATAQAALKSAQTAEKALSTIEVAYVCGFRRDRARHSDLMPPTIPI
jgi:hypothetical protein